MFPSATNFVIKDSNIISNNQVENPAGPDLSGIDKLLDKSMGDAFHDSSARWPPPRCCYGTRMDYIAGITNWALGASNYSTSILWMHGPFGAGKTAVAQSCAECLEKKKKLGASLFFSRPNARNDPTRVFTSVAYQIATKCPEFRDVVNRRIKRDATILTSALPIQFHELLVRPLRRVSNKAGAKGLVIVLDGLDECEGRHAQREIIELIAKSVCEGTTPFRWFLTSRPESHIISSMDLDTISPVVSPLELPVSRDVDHDILVYVMVELRKIGKHYRLPASWPSESDVAVIVDRAGGLFIYAATVVRFICDDNSLGPVDQLRIVLGRIQDMYVGTSNPLAEMDLLYVLILQQILPAVRSMVLKILLVYFCCGIPGDDDRAKNGIKLFQICSILDITETQFRVACRSLGSVMSLDGYFPDVTFRFYHASFMDFMIDKARSKEFCIYGNILSTLQHELIERVNIVHSRSTDGLRITNAPVHLRSLSTTKNNQLVYLYLVSSCLNVSCNPPAPLDPSIPILLLDFRFDMVPRLLEGLSGFVAFRPEQFKASLPTEFRNRLIHRSWNVGRSVFKPDWATGRPWVLGRGKNRILVWQNQKGNLILWSKAREVM